MNELVQSALVAVALLAALAYLGRRVLASLRPKSAGCGGCQRCPTADPETLVPLARPGREPESFSV